MKIILIAILMALSSNTYAKKPDNDLARAQLLWSEYKKCESEVKNELNLINCVEHLIDPEVIRYEKGKFVSYLVMGFSFSELYECGEVQDLLPFKAKPDEKYFCMNVLGNTSKLPGFIIVTSKQNNLKLRAIKYKDKL